MQTLKLHFELYSSRAIDAAVEIYREHGELGVRQAEPYFEIDVSAESAAEEAELASELANYVLALTAEERTGGSSDMAGS